MTTLAELTQDLIAQVLEELETNRRKLDDDMESEELIIESLVQDYAEKVEKALKKELLVTN